MINLNLSSLYFVSWRNKNNSGVEKPTTLSTGNEAALYCPASRPVFDVPHRQRSEGLDQKRKYKNQLVHKKTLIPFSAFWLRSSVVSVLISLISDTWANGPHDIKFIFLGWGLVTAACCWRSRASPLRSTAAVAWRTPPKPSATFLSSRRLFRRFLLPWVELPINGLSPVEMLWHALKMKERKEEPSGK